MILVTATTVIIFTAIISEHTMNLILSVQYFGLCNDDGCVRKETMRKINPVWFEIFIHGWVSSLPCYKVKAH